MKYIFAGDRDIAVSVLKFIINEGIYPEALLISDETRSTHAQDLIDLSDLPRENILEGKEFDRTAGLELLRDINPDYIIGIHFPYIISKEVLDIPKIGFLNLHPAYLPFNRGWHTPSWAILEDTPIGGTLHFMAEQLDGGDIIHQKKITPSPSDTANSLYKKLKMVEVEVFKEAWPQLIQLKPNKVAQSMSEGTSHNKKDLFKPEIQEFQLEKEYKFEDVMRKLRGLTTNNLEEAAYFMKDGKKYRMQISLYKE